MSEQQAAFTGWAKVEVMGHQSHIGFVRTEAYGMAVMFRIDQPEFPPREYVLTEPAWVDEGGGRSWQRAGAKVQRAAIPGCSVLVGSGSIYRIIPCTEAAAREAIEKSIRSELKLIEPPPDRALGAGEPESRDFECCSGNPEEGHDPDCDSQYDDDHEEDDEV